MCREMSLSACAGAVTPPVVGLPEVGQCRAPVRQSCSCRRWGSYQTFPAAFCPKPESGFGVSEIAEVGQKKGSM